MSHLSPTKIAATFDASPQRVWSRAELGKLFDEHLPAWKVGADEEPTIEPSTDSHTAILNAIQKALPLKTVALPFPYRRVTKYVWKEVGTFDIIQSVDAKGYFSHYTAVQIYNLTEQIPKSIYFNVEQPATGGGGSLSQQGIDRAFQGKCRVTNNVLKFRDYTIHKLNGQNTGRLGVISTKLNDGAVVQVTDLERTLIDIAVRPIYAGGVGEVAEAYKLAANKVSANKLTTYLKSLNYTYPYHQAIGYYMTKAGNYSDAQIKKLRALPRDFDFYLTYQLKNPVLNADWKLFVPKGF